MISNYIPFVLIPFIGWGLRKRLIQREEWHTIKQNTFWVGISAFFITELSRSFYRPFIYQHKIFDYYIADTIGNSFGTITGIFIILTLSGNNDKSDYKLILMIVLGFIGYEFLNIHDRIDFRDILATAFFGIFSALYYMYLLKKNEKQRVI